MQDGSPGGAINKMRGRKLRRGGGGPAGKQPRWGQYFTAGGLAQLGRLTGLRKLSIQGCNWAVGAWQLAALSCLSRLQVLDVSQPDARRSNFDGFALAAFPLSHLQVPTPWNLLRSVLEATLVESLCLTCAYVCLSVCVRVCARACQRACGRGP